MNQNTLNFEFFFMVPERTNDFKFDSLVPDASDFSRQNEVDHGDEQPYGLCQY